MKRKVVMAVIGTTVALQACSAGAFDTKAVEGKGLEAEYGIELNAAGSSVVADYKLEVAADKTRKMSLGAKVEAEGEKYELKQDDIVIVDAENIYLNVGGTLDTLTEIAEDQGMEDLLAPIGITEGWIALPIPAFDKLGIELNQEVTEKEPEFSPELQEDALEIWRAFGPEVEDGVTTYRIDNESILEAAKRADVFVAAHLDELAQLPTANNTNILENLDLTAAFEKYIGAVGAGMAEATGVSEEEAVDQLNQLVSLMTTLAVGSLDTSMSVNNESVTPETLSELHVYENVEEALAGSDILGVFSYDENSAELVIGSDGEMFVVDAAIQEDDTVLIEIGDGEDVYLNGNLEKTEDGLKAVVEDTQNEGIKVTADITDESLKLEFEADDTLLSLALEGVADDTKASGSFQLKAVTDGEEVSASGYGKLEIPSAPIKIEIPAASDGLEVIKNISRMAFEASMQAEPVQEAQE